MSHSQQKMWAYKETEKYGSFIGKKIDRKHPWGSPKTKTLLDKDFNCFKHAQIAEGNHGQRTKGNQENGVSKQIGNIKR